LTGTPFGLVIGFIDNPQVVTAITYYTVTHLHNLQSLHTSLSQSICISPHFIIHCCTHTSLLSHTPDLHRLTSYSSSMLLVFTADFSAITHYYILHINSSHHTLHPHRQTSRILPGSTSLASATCSERPAVSVVPLSNTQFKSSWFLLCSFESDRTETSRSGTVATSKLVYTAIA
jgi:hypothetical protein